MNATTCHADVDDLSCHVALNLTIPPEVRSQRNCVGSPCSMFGAAIKGFDQSVWNCSPCRYPLHSMQRIPADHSQAAPMTALIQADHLSSPTPSPLAGAIHFLLHDHDSTQRAHGQRDDVLCCREHQGNERARKGPSLLVEQLKPYQSKGKAASGASACQVHTTIDCLSVVYLQSSQQTACHAASVVARGCSAASQTSVQVSDMTQWHKLQVECPFSKNLST